jgi:hypothetical protein
MRLPVLWNICSGVKGKFRRQLTISENRCAAGSGGVFDDDYHRKLQEL